MGHEVVVRQDMVLSHCEYSRLLVFSLIQCLSRCIRSYTKDSTATTVGTGCRLPPQELAVYKGEQEEPEEQHTGEMLSAEGTEYSWESPASSMPFEVETVRSMPASGQCDVFKEGQHQGHSLSSLW